MCLLFASAGMIGSEIDLKPLRLPTAFGKKPRAVGPTFWGEKIAGQAKGLGDDFGAVCDAFNIARTKDPL